MLTVRQSFSYDCDVLIAGAGPAGSGLALHLARQGVKVIVAEAECFPRDKVCGDGVSPVALAELEHLGITGTDAFKQANEIRRVGLFLKNDQVIIDLSKPDHLPHHARIIPRLQLDHWIASAAQSAVVDYIQRARVADFRISDTGIHVTVKHAGRLRTLKAKLLVGADGTNSRVARQLNGAKPADEFRLLGLRSYFDGVEGPADRVDIFFNEACFPGIFWMFPLGAERANIGMAMVAKTYPATDKHIQNMLLHQIRNDPMLQLRIGKGKMDGKISGWPINFYNRNKRIADNRILLAGDAAGLINPLSGDGIQYALLSARWASEVIIQSLLKNDFSAATLQAYTRKIEAELGYDFALSNLLVQFPRNKALGKLWFSILELMIAQAKTDKVYADTVAGIFEGTYPSYKALNHSFILKSLGQGICGVERSLGTVITHPEKLIGSGVSSAELLINILTTVARQNKDQWQWLKSTFKKTLQVGGHFLRHQQK